MSASRFDSLDPVEAGTMRTIIDDILAQFPETDVKLAGNVPHIYRGNDDVFGMSAPKNRLFLDPRSDQVLYELRPRLEPKYVVLQSIFQVPSIGRSIRSCWEIWFARGSRNWMQADREGVLS